MGAMADPLRVLIVDDSDADAELLAHTVEAGLGAAAVDQDRARSATEALGLLARSSYHVVFHDLRP